MNETWWVKPSEMNEEQKAIVQIPAEGHHLVFGPPGSGKTNLLLLRAEYMSRRGQANFRIVVFNRSLKEFLAACPAPYAVHADRLKTLRGWESESIIALGGQPSSKSDFVEQRQENAKLLRQLVESSKVGTLHDVILLDEAQDFLEDEIDLFKRVSGQVFAVADARQQIYKNSHGLDRLSSFSKSHALRFHYRNGQEICRLADAIGPRWSDYTPLLPTSHYREKDRPSRATITTCSDIRECAATIVSRVRTQLNAYPDELIGVLTPRHEDLDVLRAAFLESEMASKVTFQSRDDDMVFFGKNVRICVCTTHSGKGLEFRAVHLAGAEHFKKFRESQWKLVYTSITRAKTSIAFYHCDKPPDFLLNAFASLKQHTAPDIDDLFT